MRLLALIGALALVAAVAAAGYLFGGFFDISARWEDPKAVISAIARIRDASIARHAVDRPPADIGEASRVQAGARIYASAGCVNCHGAPGVKWAKFSEGLNPDPPDLKEATGDLSPAEIFWVVQNGIRMTGMPSFGAAGFSDDDIWSIAAFAKKFPTVSEADYKAWTTPPAEAGPQPSAPAPSQAAPVPAPAPAPPAAEQTPSTKQ